MHIVEKQKELKLKRGQLYWLALEVIGLSLVAGGHPLRPGLPIMIKSLLRIFQELKKIKIEEEKLMKTLRKIERREIIDLVEKDDAVYVRLRDQGNEYILRYSLKMLLDFKKKKKKWNKKWVLVFFDVPEMQRNKRNHLRKFLSFLGFYQYQQSVYIFPYECREEVELIKKIIEGGKYLSYVIAEKIDREEEVKRFFNLK